MATRRANPANRPPTTYSDTMFNLQILKGAKIFTSHNDKPIDIVRRTFDIQKDMVPLQRLGKGAYGTAVSIQYRGTKAVGKIANTCEPISMEIFIKEAMILYRLEGAGGAPRLLALARDTPFYIMSLCEGCEFHEVRTPATVSNPTKWWMSLYLSMAKNLSELHANGCVHRDLKENNVIVSPSVGQECPKIHFIDYGLASLNSDKLQPPSDTLNLPPAHLCFYDAFTWIAPEYHYNKISSTAVDVYSLGRMISRSVRKIRTYEDLDWVCIEYLEDLVEAMTEVQPNRRPTLPKVCEKLKSLVRWSSYYLNSKTYQAHPYAESQCDQNAVRTRGQNTNIRKAARNNHHQYHNRVHPVIQKPIYRKTTTTTNTHQNKPTLRNNVQWKEHDYCDHHEEEPEVQWIGNVQKQKTFQPNLYPKHQLGHG